MTPALQIALPKADRHASQPPAAGRTDSSGGDFGRLLGGDAAETRSSATPQDAGDPPAVAADDAGLASRKDRERRDDRSEPAHAAGETASALDLLASLLASRPNSETVDRPAASSDEQEPEPPASPASEADMTSDASSARSKADTERMSRVIVLSNRQFTAPAMTSAATAPMVGSTAVANTETDSTPAVSDGSDAAPEAADAAVIGSNGKTVDTEAALRLPRRGTSASADEPARSDRQPPDRVQDGPGAEKTGDKNVTVIAASPASPTGTALATAIAADPTVRAAAAPELSMQRPGVPAPQSAHILKIELHPAELGSVTASLRFAGGQLSIEIQVENHDAYRQLNSDREELTRTLNRMGFAVDSITILQPQTVVTPAARTEAQVQSSGMPSRESAPSSGDSGQGGGGNGTGNQRSGRNQSHDAFLPRDPASGRHDDPRGGLVI